MPGFGAFPFKVYSGYLEVAGPRGGAHAYDSVTIHYELHTSQKDPATDPLVTWHQGGPGGSSMYGAYTEMGYFQVDSRGNTTNPYAWNQVANMLYLESPAGCDDPIGFSYCTKGGKVQKTCQWDDKTQAEAYAHTLAAFLESFPECAVVFQHSSPTYSSLRTAHSSWRMLDLASLQRLRAAADLQGSAHRLRLLDLVLEMAEERLPAAPPRRARWPSPLTA